MRNARVSYQIDDNAGNAYRAWCGESEIRITLEQRTERISDSSHTSKHVESSVVLDLKFLNADANKIAGIFKSTTLAENGRNPATGGTVVQACKMPQVILYAADHPTQKTLKASR